MYKIMIADDEPIMRNALEALVDWKDIQCEVLYMASNGQEVLDKLQYMKPDILLLDIKMPGADGIEISKYIWEKKLPIQVIILTAYADFSYAQSAIEYNVVDYVTKTGAFDRLLIAVEKAKERITKERYPKNELIKENYFRDIISGSLYDKEELEEKAITLDIDYKKGFVSILFNIIGEDNYEVKERKGINKNLLKFLYSVFKDNLIQGINIKWNRLIVYLNQEEEDFENVICEKCSNIITMMNNLMNIQLYIGISSRGNTVEGFKRVYGEAESALINGFLDEENKIYFYKNINKRKSSYSKSIDKRVEDLCYLIKKGEKETSIEKFKELIKEHKDNNESTDMIKNTGIFITSRCQKILLDYEKNLSDIISNSSNVSNKIYLCINISEYEVIMRKIIEETAGYVGKVSSKKSLLICECEKFIEDNYYKYITVSDVARNVGVTPSYLSRIFHNLTGDTVINSINKRKLEKAKEYLENTDMKIYEIADALGFENMTYFSHFFKKYTGVSPKEYSR